MGTAVHLALGMLAQAPGGQPLGQYLIWIGAFIAIIVVSGLALLAYRKRMLGPLDAGGAGGIMDELRQMLKDGRMTQQEYDAAKRAIVAKITGQESTAKPPPAPRPSGLQAKPGFDLTGAPLPERKPPTQQPPDA